MEVYKKIFKGDKLRNLNTAVSKELSDLLGDSSEKVDINGKAMYSAGALYVSGSAVVSLTGAQYANTFTQETTGVFLN